MKILQRTSGERGWFIWLGDPQPPGNAPLHPLSTAAVAELLARCSRHGVLPAAVRNIRRLARAGDYGSRLLTDVSSTSTEHLEKILATAGEELVQIVGRSELLRALQVELIATLQAHGIEPIVLKGTSFADQLYPDPSLRPFTDIDLLVPERAMPDARRAVTTMGLVPVVSSRKKHIEPYAEECWTHPALTGLLVELHWDLIGSPKVRRAVSLTYEDLLPLMGTDGRPGPLALLLIAAIHGAAGHAFELLQHVIDVAQAARCAAGSLNSLDLCSGVKQEGQRLALEAAVLTAALILSDDECNRFARSMGARYSARLLSRLLGVAAVLDARGDRHFRYSWRRQIYRETLIRLADGS